MKKVLLLNLLKQSKLNYMIFNIFKKELKETLRDKRTLIMMLVIPILIFPLILNVVVGVSSSFEESAENKTLKIGILGESDDYLALKLNEIPNALGPKTLIPYHGDSLKMKADLKEEKLDIVFIYDSKFSEKLDKMEPTKLICVFDKTNIGYEQRAQKYVQYIEAEERLKRYQTLNIDEQQITPFEIAFENSASNQKMIGELVGGFLPYIFIAFGFMGCMYPAIDLFTGEKERGTIETLLTTPVSRWKFLIGKMLVIILSGLMASFFALLGLFFSINFMDIIPDPEIMNVVNQILSLGFVLKLFLLLLPLTVFFAGIMIPIAVYTKTFKEAQSIIAPLNIIVLLPAMAGLFPGIELNVQTALIPILNIVLTTKGLIGGTIDYSLLILSFSVMVVLAGIAVAVSFKQFGKETNILS